MTRLGTMLLLLMVFGPAPRASGSPTPEEFLIREVNAAEINAAEINASEMTGRQMTGPQMTGPERAKKAIRRPIRRPMQSSMQRPIQQPLRTRPLQTHPLRTGAATTVRLRPKQQPSSLTRIIRGSASWYGPGFYGRQTASGERLRKGTFTAAHRTLPFGTKVRVTNLSNGRAVVVRINDRGPFKRHRVIDLAHGAASELRMMQAGEIPVRLEVLR